MATAEGTQSASTELPINRPTRPSFTPMSCATPSTDLKTPVPTPINTMIIAKFRTISFASR